MPTDIASIIARAVAAVFAVVLRLARASWRRQGIGMEVVDQALTRQERLLVVFWHTKHIALFPLVEGFDAWILTNRSFRGQVIAALAGHFGYHSIFLDHKHGQELQQLLDDLLQKHRCLAIAVDGPLGPLHRVRPSLVRLASQLKLLVVPLSVAAQPKIVMRRRWDKMEIPLPCSRVLFGVGKPFKVPPDVQPDGIEAWMETIQKNIEETDQMIDNVLTVK
ncbi:lysophospholipid acyltransferase family protein [Desulfocastanea catecholica]